MEVLGNTVHGELFFTHACQTISTEASGFAGPVMATLASTIHSP